MSSLIIHILAVNCEAPKCDRPATKSVNYAFMADYMRRRVCDIHVDWAASYLKQFIPTESHS